MSILYRNQPQRKIMENNKSNLFGLIAVGLAGVTAFFIYKIYQTVTKINIPDIDYTESWKDQ